MAAVDRDDRVLDLHNVRAAALQFIGELPHGRFVVWELVDVETHYALPETDDMTDVVFGSEVDPVDCAGCAADGSPTPGSARC